MIVLDASVVIAHFNVRDAHHEVATQWLIDSHPESLVMHPITVAELLVGAVRSGVQDAVQADLDDLGISTATIDDSHPMRLARLRAETGLKMPDCCVLAVAEERRAGIATFDRRLTTAAAERGIVTLPA